MGEKKNINITIDHGNFGWFSDGMSLFNRQDKFFIDFRQNTPRIDVLGDKQQQTHAVKHNTVILDPVMAKALSGLLQDSLKNYEKQYGKVKMPKMNKIKEAEAGKSESNYIG